MQSVACTDGVEQFLELAGRGRLGPGGPPNPPPAPGTGGVAGGGGWANQASQQKLNAQLTSTW
jgi:hypothetical protein